jgi:hypothetical protein
MPVSQFDLHKAPSGPGYVGHWHSTKEGHEVFPGDAELLARLQTLRIRHLTPEQIMEAFKSGQERQILTVEES